MCEDATGDLSASDGASVEDHGWVDIAAVEIDDTSDAFEVLWGLAGDVPERAEIDGTVVTNL